MIYLFIFYVTGVSHEGWIPAPPTPFWKDLGPMLSKINSLRQISKFTWNVVNTWCNFTVSFSSR